MPLQGGERAGENIASTRLRLCDAGYFLAVNPESILRTAPARYNGKCTTLSSRKTAPEYNRTPTGLFACESKKLCKHFNLPAAPDFTSTVKTLDPEAIK